MRRRRSNQPIIVTIDPEKSQSPRSDSTWDLVGDKEPKIKPPSFRQKSLVDLELERADVPRR